MNNLSAVRKEVYLPAVQAARSHRLAKLRATSEDEIIARALDILFDLTDLLDDQAEQQGWSYLSEASLTLVWDNDKAAAYDNWRELYGVSAG
ncbi:MAG: hypothetical protein GY759_12950 [Chloroflexi bacterium]|nr:hypothetical protein [Chloroflexota bacterium]